MERTMADGKKPRLIGINHVAIEVGDIDQALEWYGRIFDFNLRGNPRCATRASAKPKEADPARGFRVVVPASARKEG